jgi:hypothetical protein
MKPVSFFLPLFYQIMREVGKAPPMLFPDYRFTTNYIVQSHVRNYNRMQSNFKNFVRKARETNLATYSEDEMHQEIAKRQTSKTPFPLQVFSEDLKPFITALTKHYDIPRSFVGLAMLSAISTAIGTAYAITTNRRDYIYIPVWGALVGMPGSGKSLALNKLFAPLRKIQTGFDVEWKQVTQGLSPDKINQQLMKTVIYRDSNIATLIRSVMPDNPKGVLKFSDELIEWINGMNQLSKKEGTDEQFWLSSWNCSEYSGIRSGKQKFVVEKPFVGIIGGLQHSMLFRLFKNDRDTTGFVNRILFATLDTDKIAMPDPTFEMPVEFEKPYENIINRLYTELPVADADCTKRCLLLPQAVKVYQDWSKKKARDINKLREQSERETHAAILGKTKEYALRFAAILHLADCALRPHTDFQHRFKEEEQIDIDTLLRGIEVADYFFNTAVDVYEKVAIATTAPMEVLMCANLTRRGKSYREIAEVLFGHDPVKRKPDMYIKQTERKVKEWIKSYPKVFGSAAK